MKIFKKNYFQINIFITTKNRPSLYRYHTEGTFGLNLLSKNVLLSLNNHRANLNYKIETRIVVGAIILYKMQYLDYNISKN